MDVRPTHFFKATGLDSPITEFAFLLVGGDGDRIYPLGSGVFVAPALGVTAKHVVDEFWKQLGPGLPFRGALPIDGHFTLMAIQYPGRSAEPALWYANFGWGTSLSDLFVLGFKPANDVAERYRWERALKLNLLPPSIGERVVGFGYASSEAEMASTSEIQLGLHPSTTGGRVTAVFPERRDRGLLKFPCFEIEAHFIGGMSGGPLFNQTGALCGVICAGRNGEPISYGSTLWPVMMTVITHEGPGQTCNGPYPVSELIDIGVLHATGWDEIVHRIEIQTDLSGDEMLHLRPE